MGTEPRTTGIGPDTAEVDVAEVTRRTFLARMLGGTAAATLSIAGLAETALADEDHVDQDEHGHEAADEGPASTRVRRWALVIDLRKCDGCVELGSPPQCTQACIWAR